MTRAERRAKAKALSSEFGVSFDVAFNAVQAGVENRAVALALGEEDKQQGFTAATNALVGQRERTGKFENRVRA